MQFRYTLEEDDYLQFQLFTASRSERIKKRKKTGWLILTTFALMGTLYFIREQNTSMTIYLAIVTGVVAIFYPTYFRWKFKKHYIKFIRENYSSRVGKAEFIEFNTNHIFLKDSTGEGKVKNSEIEGAAEIPNHYFLKISNGNSLIIPKSGINENDLLNCLDKINVKIESFTNWKWQ